MHIVIIADAIDNQKAGIHYYTKTFVENLIKYDKKNKYTFIHCRSNSFFKGQNEIIIESKGQIYEFFRKIFIIPKVINALKPDLIIEPAHFGPFRIKKPAKTISIIHDLSNFLFPKFHKLKTNIVHKIFLPKIIKSADYIITPSNTTKSDIEKVFKRKKNIFTIFPSLTIPKKPSKKPIIKFPYILFIGTIEPRKNIDTLIDAFLEIKNEKKLPHKLIIAGKSGWKNSNTMKKMINKDIKHLGYISEKQKVNLINFADLFVFPSFYEGFGIPPLEALSYGIPTITSTGGSLKEIFEKITLNHSPQDKETLKRHIYTCLTNKKIQQHFKKNGPIFAKKFIPQISAKKFIQLFDQISKINKF